MSDDGPASTEFLSDDSRFQSLLVKYLVELEEGRTMDPERLRRDHPQYAESLIKFLADHDSFQKRCRDAKPAPTYRVVDSAFARTVDSGSNGPHPKIAIGDRLRFVGQYELLSEIARGGMGIVFKARQMRLRRIVALKMILAGRFASQADVNRFEREARAAARLRHPNIVSVHEIATHQNHHYFTMDFIDGESLSRTIADESLPPRRAAQVLAKVARAIQYAHDNGVLHRDLKPANILIDTAGEPHVTDFGLAKSAIGDGDSVELTDSGQILGTPSYMSPEQAAGKQQLVSVASDVYSMGAILYACISGRAPFIAESTVDTIRQVIEKEPVSPRVLNPDLPRDLETVCLKCLQKEPHQRYPTAAALADDLERFLDGRPVLARPVSFSTRSFRWAKRNPVIAGLVTLSVALLIVGSAASTYFAIDAHAQAVSEKTQRVRATAAAKDARVAETKMRAAMVDAQRAQRQAEAALRTSQWNVYKMGLFPMIDALENGEFGALEESLAASQPDPSEPDFRDWEWRFLQRAVLRQSQVRHSQHRYDQVRYAPQGDRLALRRQDGSIDIRDSERFELVRTIDGSGQRHLAWHPTEPWLAAAEGTNEVKVYHAASGELLHSFQTRNDRTGFKDRGVAWSRDGNQIALGGFQRIDLFDLRSDDVRTLKVPVRVNTLHWTPDDTTLAAGGTSMVCAVDVSSEKVLWRSFRSRIPVLDVKWSPDGSQLAGTWDYPDYCIRIYGNDGKVQRTLPVGQNTVAVAWSEDGKRLVSAGRDEKVHHWQVAKGKRLRSIAMHNAIIQSMDVQWDRDEATTVDVNGTVRTFPVANVPLHEFQLSVETGPSRVWSLKWHPTRPNLFAVGSSHRISVVDTALGKVVQTVTTQPRSGVFAWHPTDETIAMIQHDGVITSWDARTGKQIAQMDATSIDFTVTLQWHPDGEQLLVGTGQRVRHGDPFAFEIRRFEQPKSVQRYATPANRSVARWFPDGRRVATHCGRMQDKIVEIWDVRAGALLARSEKIGGFLEQMAVHPAGESIALGGDGGELFLLDGQTAEIVHRQNAHSASIRSIRWSPDGERLLTCSDDNVLRLWDRATADSICSFDGLFGPAADWSANGEQIASCTRNGTVRVWSAAPFELQSQRLAGATR